jgi:hypothetical protein
MAGLRSTLFETIDQLRSGVIDDKTAKSVAVLSQTILNSAQVQMDYEKLRLDSMVPGSLPEMPLVPKLKGVA